MFRGRLSRVKHLHSHQCKMNLGQVSFQAYTLPSEVGGGDFLLNPACVDGTYLKSEGEECQCEWSVVGMLNMSSGLFPNAAICPQGCRNGGVCVAPGICSCPEGWLGGACHTGEFQLVPMNRAQLKHETTSSKDVRQDFYAGVRESRHLLTSVAACWRFSPSPPSVFSFYD